MRILIIHPVLSFLGGGERLCCESIRALVGAGHEVTLLSEEMDTRKIESFFGYKELFSKINLIQYPRRSTGRLGSYSHILHSIRSQKRRLQASDLKWDSFDVLFSTQDPAYIPDTKVATIQWGYFPRNFGRYPTKSFSRVIRGFPLELYYKWKIARIGLVLAISEYSKAHLERDWRRPITIVYPACNMIPSRRKRDLVVTAARAIPEKRLELFWEVAKRFPQDEFAMLVTTDPGRTEYMERLAEQCPPNGKIIRNPDKELYSKYLGESKAYLHMMRGEHFGITIVEAMSACSVPIVHDSGGPSELVDSRIGFKWRRIEEIPQLLTRILNESHPCNEYRQKAEFFNFDGFEKRLSSVFATLKLSRR